jgi:hypothetical protein
MLFSSEVSVLQMIAMLFCRLGQARGLHEITGGLAACEGKVRHPGVKGPPKRSTLSYANEHRPWLTTHWRCTFVGHKRMLSNPEFKSLKRQRTRIVCQEPRPLRESAT